MNEQRRYDVDWTDENNPQIVIAQPGDEYAMTLTEAERAIRDGMTDAFIDHMANQDPARLESDRAAAWGTDPTTEK